MRAIARIANEALANDSLRIRSRDYPSETNSDFIVVLECWSMRSSDASPSQAVAVIIAVRPPWLQFTTQFFATGTVFFTEHSNQ
jgi:hypothetical protein